MLNLKMKKLLEKSILPINNKGFILPTITIFLMVLISFVMWQTYNNLDFMYVTNKYNDSIILQIAYQQVNETVLREIADKDDTICTLNSYPIYTSSTHDYKISIKYICLRKPLKDQNNPIISHTLRKMFRSVENKNGEVTKKEYQAIKNDIMAIEALEFTEEIVGPWVGIDDFEQALVEASIAPELIVKQVEAEIVRRYEINRMQRYLIFDCDIQVKELKKRIMYIYNADTNKLENKIIA